MTVDELIMSLIAEGSVSKSAFDSALAFGGGSFAYEALCITSDTDQFQYILRPKSHPQLQDGFNYLKSFVLTTNNSAHKKSEVIKFLELLAEASSRHHFSRTLKGAFIKPDAVLDQSSSGLVFRNPTLKPKTSQVPPPQPNPAAQLEPRPKSEYQKFVERKYKEKQQVKQRERERIQEVEKKKKNEELEPDFGLTFSFICFVLLFIYVSFIAILLIIKTQQQQEANARLQEQINTRIHDSPHHQA